ncbi:ABC transporter permease [Streptomyces sp. NPDC005931]|uniref:ABC transporter permease n=1 Tax=Streptomyces sp. NPDC005931 TaxID=3364737 RepID=UPI00368C93E4
MTGTAAGRTGTFALTRLALRRDRFTLAAWILGLSLFTAGITAMSVSGMPTRQDVVQETELMAGNAAMRMLGLASGASVGGYTLVRGHLTLAVLAALMSAFTVVRHTRQNEETGRADLLGATGVGRYAGLTAGVVVAVGANVVLSALLGLAMILNGQPVAGSLTAGASVGAVGVVFAGVAAIAVQLSSTTRGANGIAVAVLAIAFLLSGVGNMLGRVDGSGVRVVSAWPAWLSPIGWGQQMRPFGGDHWWPLALFAGLFTALLAVAGALVRRRDVGRGLLPGRRGRTEAAPGLLSPFGLVWRLQRGALLAWAVGMLGFGLVLGAIGGEVKDMEGAARDWYARVGGTGEIVDAYRTSIIGMAGMAAAVYVVQVLLRMRAEETEGRLEPVLATAVSRARWATGHILNAASGAAVLLLLFALGMGLTAGRSLGGGAAGQLGDLTTAALAQLPAILALGGLVVAVVGLLPRWAGAFSWTVVMASVLLGPLFAPTLKWPQWAQNLSPFTHTPRAPAAAIGASSVIALLVAFTVLAAAGVVASRHRNLALPG